MENCTVIDLFCGAGALTHGFVLEGFKSCCRDRCRQVMQIRV